MTITDAIVPNMVGVDIGCGMRVMNLEMKSTDIDVEKFDNFVRKSVPSGFNVHEKTTNEMFTATDIRLLLCAESVNLDRAYKSIGTLGGGNHFIELDKDENNNAYLVVHTGSRNLGKQIAEHYQRLAINQCATRGRSHGEIQALIDMLKRLGRESEIQETIKKFKLEPIDKDFAYLTNDLMSDYLHDMIIAQDYARVNRDEIAYTLTNFLGVFIPIRFETVHNYIDVKNMILRKGAVSARKGEPLIIPMNMRDGSLICIGKGNEDWNCSAPHGAGRIMSRTQAKANITLQQFEKSMEGIYSTSVNKDTIDESPMAYKPMQEIIDNISETVEIERIIKPFYNFKAGE
jgi:RNA-splicing ligase RtcB